MADFSSVRGGSSSSATSEPAGWDKMLRQSETARALREQREIAQLEAEQQGDVSALRRPLKMQGRDTFLPFQYTEKGRELAVPGIAASAVNALTAPGRALRGDEVGPDEGLNFAMSTVGGGAPMAPTGRGITGITAWHGSPHKFDAFDMSKIGTGEGAQAYGHGLYFAENPGVARDYAKNVKDMGTITQQNAEMSRLAKIMSKDEIPGQYGKYRTEEGREAKRQYDALMEARSAVSKAPGNLYKVDLPDEHIAKMIDWDKPLSQQTPEVKASLNALPDVGLLSKQAKAEGKKLSDMNWQGQDFLTALREWLPNVGKEDVPISRLKVDPAAASEFLRSGGIPGVRYLDQGSRGAGSGSTTSNFVVFDDQIPKILSRE